ncbi:MAG: ORF6N domain-containing protein [Candidatus Riflebacteria bacterium]|nr:ORF6N domain-containing protein [Candidatus Riflebacteria bacterium]
MSEKEIIFVGNIEKNIYRFRNKNVMLDSDLAELYGVETRRLNEQVKRNLKRFPESFMFELTKEEESQILKSQNATSSYGGRKNHR